MDFSPKRSVFVQKWPKNGHFLAIFRKIRSGKTAQKSSRKLFTSHMFCFFVSQHIREGVDNLTWSLYLLTGEKFKKTPIYTHFVTFFGQNLKKKRKIEKKILSGEKAQKCSRTLSTPYVSCVCVSACVERCW